MIALVEKIFLSEPMFRSRLLVNPKEVWWGQAKLTCLVPTDLDGNTVSKGARGEGPGPVEVLPREVLARGYLWSLRVEV